MRAGLTKRRIVTLVAVFAAIAFFPLLIMLLGAYGTAMLILLFPILGFLPISSVLLLTFVGGGAIAVWAFYKRDLKRTLLPCLALILPAFAATILIVYFPIFEFIFNIFFFPLFLAVMLSMFTGLGAVVVDASYGQDIRRVLKLIVPTIGAIILSILLWMILYLGPMWIALSFMPHWRGFMSSWTGLSLLPRILTIIVAGLAVAYLYWPGKKRGRFLEVLGPVMALELVMFITISLIIL